MAKRLAAATSPYLLQHKDNPGDWQEWGEEAFDEARRPDVDAVYMSATQALTGQGGWPMTVFLTPQGRPFYAGTYFPPTPRSGMPSFSQVLAAIAEAWQTQRDEVEAAGG